MWADLTKCGTLQQDKLDDITEAIRKLLAARPTRMVAYITAPVLAGAKVVAGKRGELRHRFTKHMLSRSVLFP